MESKLILFMVSVELLALGSLFSLPTPYSTVSYYLVHTIPASISAFISYGGLRRGLRDVKAFSFLYLISFSLGTPGIVLSLLIPYVITRVLKVKPYYNYELIPLDYVLEFENLKVLKIGEGKLRSIIRGKGSVEEKILTIKLFSQSLEEIEKLNYFLQNPDESRLYAFSLISKLEKEYQDRIKELQDIFEKDKDPQVALKLAEAYYEFSVSGLISRELTNFYLERAREFAQYAHNKIGDKYEVLLIAGRIAKALGDCGNAFYFLEKLYSQHQTFNITLELAELYFLTGNLSKLKEIMRTLVERFPYLSEDPVTKVWTHGGC